MRTHPWIYWDSHIGLRIAHPAALSRVEYNIAFNIQGQQSLALLLGRLPFHSKLAFSREKGSCSTHIKVDPYTVRVYVYICIETPYRIRDINGSDGQRKNVFEWSTEINNCVDLLLLSHSVAMGNVAPSRPHEVIGPCRWESKKKNKWAENGWACACCSRVKFIY